MCDGLIAKEQCESVCHGCRSDKWCLRGEAGWQTPARRYGGIDPLGS